MRPLESPETRSDVAAWSLRLAILLLVVQFAAQLLFLAIALAVLPAILEPGGIELDGQEGSAAAVVTGVAAYLFAGATTLELARHLAHRLGYSSLREAVGLRSTSLWTVGVGIALLTALVSDSMSLVLGKPIVPPEYRSTFATLAGGIAFGAFTVAVPPVVEEVIFRGVLYPALAHTFSPTLAVLVNAAVFGLVHVFTYGTDWYVILLTAITGLALAFLRAYTGSLWPCVAAHATINAYASLEALLLPRMLGYWP